MAELLRRRGYEIDVWCLDAANHKVPQHRRRSFIIASKIGLPNPPAQAAIVASREAFRSIDLR